MKRSFFLKTLFRACTGVASCALMAVVLLPPASASEYNYTAGNWSSNEEHTPEIGGNSVTVAGVKDEYGGVYGACSWGDTNTHNNQVTITQSTLNYICGGYSEYGTSSLNTVSINGSSLTDSTYAAGGCSNNGNEAIDNSVSMTQTTLGADTCIIGGFAFEGTVAKNALQLTRVSQPDPNAAWTNYPLLLRGGSSDYGTVSGNSILLAYSELSADQIQINGGYAWEGALTNNAVRIENTHLTGDSNFIYGALSEYGADTGASGNSVNLFNSQVGSNAEIAGAVAWTSTAELTGNSVTITDSRVGENSRILGADSECGNASNNKVALSGSNIEGGIFGAEAEGNATGNEVHISNSTFHKDVYGGAARADATGNTVSLTNVTCARSKFQYEIYGGLSYQGGNATGNTVSLAGSNELSALKLYGGKVERGMGDEVTGNTLNIHGHQGKVKGIYNFSTINITLSDWRPGEAILTATGNDTNLTGTKVTATIISIAADAPSPEAGELLPLFGNMAGTESITPALSQSKGIRKGAFYLYDFEGADNAHIRVTAKRVNPQAKALAEGRIAVLSLNNRAGNLVAENGITQAARTASTPQNRSCVATFIATSGGNDKVHSGSHVNVDSFSALVGASIGLLPQQALTLGGFAESGWGQYRTHNNFANAAPVRGTGESSYGGGGVLAHYSVGALPGLELDASLRTGRQDSDFSSADIGGEYMKYDLSSSYIAGHIGTSYTFSLAERLETTVYARYLWSHLGSDHANMKGEQVDFASAHSNRLRFGTRATWMPCCRVQRYIGLAYEWECSGTARATVGGSNISAPSMRGGSLIGEIGTSWQPWEQTPLWLNGGVQGSVGKVQGYGANIGCTVAF